jgi:hypothetical protein
MKNQKTSEKRKPATPKTLSKTPPAGECKEQILLRHVPCQVVELITRKKAEIMTNNPYRTTVSNSEAIYKLILKG